MNIDSFYIEILKDNSFLQQTTFEEKVLSDIKLESTCILVTKNYIGGEDNQLGQLLMKSFFYVMSEKETKPSDIILINRGVFLAAEGSPVLSALHELDRNGVSIMCCGTSLNHFKVREELNLGFVSNMYDIVEVLLRAKKVITL
ncbi:MAG TPA: sulfurtransferase-like selenium metabolism protein YedF [Candidatus Wallbacteria bacterium]|nr:sulfurtransferase-like selenium metabolism protein YedF [Candidatus Wallbacteria bacterium]